LENPTCSSGKPDRGYVDRQADLARLIEVTTTNDIFKRLEMQNRGRRREPIYGCPFGHGLQLASADEGHCNGM